MSPWRSTRDPGRVSPGMERQSSLAGSEASEQDLAICRVLCDLFNADPLAETIAFRGGTAIHKLLFAHPLRYSEDIDLVQTKAGPIGKTVDAIRRALAWLGPCKRTQAAHSMHLYFSGRGDSGVLFWRPAT